MGTEYWNLITFLVVMCANAILVVVAIMFILVRVI
jgi:hypothetical protein